MALYDNIFDADFACLDDIYWHEIPAYKDGMELKVKGEKLDIPILQEPECTGTGYQTSDKIPLKVSTWARILVPLLTASWNIDKVPLSICDQVADHDLNTMRYYIDLVVQTDMWALVMGLP